MIMHSGEMTRRALPRLVIVLFLLLVALLALFGARPGSTVYADLQCGDDIAVDDFEGDLLEKCKEPKKGPTCDEGEHREGGVCVPTIDCGKDPYKWNPFEGAYQRPFNKWCEPQLFDSNENLYDGMTCDEVAAALGQNEQSFCDWSEVFG
jgi:hypothetical protein